MLSRYYQFIGAVLVCSDAVGILCAWIAAYFIRFYTNFIPITKGLPPFSQYLSFVIFVIFIWIAVFSYLKIYRPAKIQRRTHEVRRVFIAHCIATLCFLALNYFLFSFDTSVERFGEYDFRFSRAAIGIFLAISGLYLVVSRLVVRNYLRQLRVRGQFAENVLFVGSGVTALAVIDSLRRIPELGSRVVGYLAEEESKKLAIPLLGKFLDIKRVIRENQIDRVIICLPRNDSVTQNSILEQLRDETVDLHIVPDLYEFVTLGCSVESMDGLPVLTLNNPPISPLGVLVKRAFDFVGALILLFIFSPVFFLLAVAVKATSRGPIFYGQKRMGLDGSTFIMWKFRSMIPDAEEKTGAVWASKNDTRRTPLGSFLRSTSLDEIPQFYNVLKGEMSLVGPRPERPEFVSNFRSKLPSYMLRHKMKSGITGWAQINGWRGNTSLERRLESDLYYIQNWSFWLDLRILLLTPIKGFINKNAY